MATTSSSSSSSANSNAKRRKVEAAESEFVSVPPTGLRVVNSTKVEFENNVDLKSGIRVWECAVDLAKYIGENHSSLSSSTDSSSSVSCRLLELGCGHAVPAMALMKDRPNMDVVLQDYSQDVLDKVAKRNIEENDFTKQRISYKSGSWEDYLVELKENDGMPAGGKASKDASAASTAPTIAKMAVLPEWGPVQVNVWANSAEDERIAQGRYAETEVKTISEDSKTIEKTTKTTQSNEEDESSDSNDDEEKEVSAGEDEDSTEDQADGGESNREENSANDYGDKSKNEDNDGSESESESCSQVVELIFPCEETNNLSFESFDTKKEFDVILCSEGIYKEETFDVLVSIVEETLSEKGVALFAAKRYYFGCGGGTQNFAKFVNTRGKLTAKVEKVYNDKKSNLREIVKIVRK